MICADCGEACHDEYCHNCRCCYECCVCDDDYEAEEIERGYIGGFTADELGIDPEEEYDRYK